MPLIERLLHPMLADDAVRPAFQSFGVASDVGGRLGSCVKPSTSIVAAIVNRKRSLTSSYPIVFSQRVAWLTFDFCKQDAYTTSLPLSTQYLLRISQ